MNPDAVTALLLRLGPAKLVVIDTLLASVGAEGYITNLSDTARAIQQIKQNHPAHERDSLAGEP